MAIKYSRNDEQEINAEDTFMSGFKLGIRISISSFFSTFGLRILFILCGSVILYYSNYPIYIVILFCPLFTWFMRNLEKQNYAIYEQKYQLLHNLESIK